MIRLHAPKVAPFRPSVEVLEARNLLSTFTVDHLADDLLGDGLNGSLRYCIKNAIDGDDIQFDPSVTGTINLTGALPDLTHSISLDGPGPDQLTVRRDTGGYYRIFTVDSGTTVSISGLTISNGLVEAGGGIYNNGGGIYNAGTLTLSNATLSGNVIVTSFSTYGNGGGIYNSGTLTLNRSTVSGNSASLGGDIDNAGGGTVTVSNTTVSGNYAFGGGGIYNSGTVTLNNATVSDNHTYAHFYYSSGIDNHNGTLHTRNTLIAGNTGLSGVPDLAGNLGSLGHNLIGNTQGGSGFDPTDLLNVNPMLSPLQDNGGPTKTMALLPGSPAIDAGDNTDAPDWDQRGEGFPRIVGIIDPNNPVIDIGAFEVQNSGGPGRATSPHAQSARPDVAGLLSAAVLPSPAPLFSPTLVNVPTRGTLPGEGVGVVDRFVAWLNQRDAGFAMARPMHQAHAEASRWGLDLFRGDERLEI
jgi:hypothetical protein